MAAAEGANVHFGGDATGAVAAAKQAHEAVAGAVKGMQATLAGLNEQFRWVTKGFAAVTAAVAGGSALKEFVSAAQESTRAAVDMGKSLGVSATEASYFRVALDDFGVPAEAVAMAGKRITMALAQGGEKFKQLGVATRDANGEFRNSKDIMLDVNEKLRGFKEGTDRNVEAMKIYGRSYQELMPFINKFKTETEEGKKKLEESRQKAEQLNLVVGQESVDAMAKYKAAKRDMNDVIEGVEKTIGEALIPRLTRMAEWFNSVGPTAVAATRGAMSLYLTVQDAVAESVATLWTCVKEAFSSIVSSIKSAFGLDSEPMSGMQFFANVLTVIKVAVLGFSMAVQNAMGLSQIAIQGTGTYLAALGKAAWQVLHGDFSDAKSTIVKAAEKVEADTKAVLDRMANNTVRQLAAIKEALDADPMAAGKVTPTGGKGDGKAGAGAHVKSPDDGAAAVAKARAEAELALKKEVYAESERALQAQFGQELIDTKAFYAAKLGLTLAGLKAEEDAKRAELAAVNAKAGKAAKEGASAQEINALVAQRIGLESQLAVIGLKRADATTTSNREEAKALDDLNKKKQTAAAESAKTLRGIELDAEEEKLRALHELHVISDEEEIAGQRRLLQQRYENEKQSLEQRLALAKFDQMERIKLENELAALQAKHQLELTKNTNKAAAQAAKPMLNFMESARGAFERGLESMFDRTKTFGQKMKAIWVDLATAFVREFVTKRVTAFLFGENTMTAAHAVGTATRVATEWWAAAQSVAATAWSVVKNIAAKAWEVAAAVYSAIASIPYVGPFLAPVMAVAATAAVLSFAGHVMSAEGGYDIPAGVNPMTQLHEREMVLPAEHADTIRGLRGDGGGGGNMTVKLEAHPMPGNYFMVHRDKLVTALKSARRDNAWKPS